MKAVSVLVVVALAACAAEPTPNESSASSALSLGTPRYTTISPQLNPHRPPQSYRYRIHSVPTFDSAFSYAGTTYPYTMVGTKPALGGSTVVSTSIVPTRFVFSDGTVLDGNDSVNGTLGSPVFQNAKYTVGVTQFSDAVQRAEFWSKMNSNYHVLLGHPVVKPTVDFNVPDGSGFAIQLAPGLTVALVDINWFYGAAISQLGPSWNVSQFPIVLSHNVFFYIGDTSQCCVLGFHDAYLTGYTNPQNKFDVQTWAWASYSDPGIFGPVAISDVHALSHEVSEWINDPFGFNQVPPWQGNDAYGCSPVLETGDPLVGHAFPVTINGTTYNPQTQALLPWFARENPSSAWNHAYSYPDTTALTTLPNDCTF